MLTLFIAKEQTCVDRGLMNLSKQTTCHTGLGCGSERIKGRDQSTWHPFRLSYKRLLGRSEHSKEHGVCDLRGDIRREIENGEGHEVG